MRELTSQFQVAAQKLLDYGFTPEDVRDFGRYWREGHPIGSNKRNAGRPHLSQVLEDLPRFPRLEPATPAGRS